MSNLAMTLALATPEELPDALALLDDAALWLQSIGIHQWQSPPPPSFIDFMQEEIAAGQVFLVRTGQGDPPVATFRIAYHDLPRWHDDGCDNALYVYSLAIRNNMRGLGIGSQILNAIAERAAGQGIDWLRLDCWARNTRLKSHYASIGFQQAGEVNDDGFQLVLFQVHVSSGKRPFA
jgi:ribosomal protein S18 acetylase RimI-like enzyme